MELMQSSIVSVNNSNNEKIYAKLCTRPATDQLKIFDALNFTHRPFVRKTKIVPQLQKTKIQMIAVVMFMKPYFQVGLSFETLLACIIHLC
jgi:hypothetical protein